MFDYKSEALAYSISLENAELREEQLKQELLATQITAENLRVVTPEMRNAAITAAEDWSKEHERPYADTLYLAMLEAA